MAMTVWRSTAPPIPASADPAGPPPEYSANDRRALDRLMASANEQPIYRAPPFRPGAPVARAPSLPTASLPSASLPSALAPAPLATPALPPPTAPVARAPAPAPAQSVRLVPEPSPPQVSTTSDANQPWRRHAVAVTPLDDRPMIAVVIDDAGVDRAHTAQAIRLRAPVTIRSEMLHRLVRDLDSFPGYVGINNHMGSRFTSNAESMGTVAAELKRRGLLFLDSRTTAQSVAFQVAVEHGVPSAVRDVFLDNEDRSDAVARRLAELEQIARRQGHAIAIGHPREVTLGELAPWLAGVEARGFRLVPVSAVVMSRITVAGELGRQR